MSDTALVDNRSRLQALLEAANPEYVHKTLLSALPKTSAGEVDMLSTILSPLASAATTKLHCVRCHKSYFEHDNNTKACRITHDGRAEGVWNDDYDEDAMVEERCCGLVYAEDDVPSKWCIVREHTTKVEEVNYYDEDKEDDDEEMNMLVVTCAQKGCLKKRKKTAGGGGRAKKVAKSRLATEDRDRHSM
jgi:hypothetical protein